MHDVLPTSDWCMPALHTMHCSTALNLLRAPSPKVPTSQPIQKVARAASWYLPPGHARHSTSFSDEEYMPASQNPQ